VRRDGPAAAAHGLDGHPRRAGPHPSVPRGKWSLCSTDRLVNFELKLADLDLLAGPNGSGKSSVLDVIYGLQLLVSGEAKVNDERVLPFASLTRWNDRDIQVIELDVQLETEQMQYRLEVQHETGGRRARILVERLTARDGALQFPIP